MEKGKEKGVAMVKAILVVNMKQDDLIARKNIPELISLAAKYVGYCYPLYPVSFSLYRK